MSHSENKCFMYRGPVMEFDRCVCSQWEATTFAPSAAKAMSNLAYRYKRDHNKASNAKITLPGVVVEIA